MTDSSIYSDSDLSGLVEPKQIKPWQLFENKYNRASSRAAEEDLVKELHLCLPGQYANMMNTLQLQEDGSWKHYSFNFSLPSAFEEDEFRIVKNKQLRISIQDGIMGFRILDVGNKNEQK